MSVSSGVFKRKDLLLKMYKNSLTKVKFETAMQQALIR